MHKKGLESGNTLIITPNRRIAEWAKSKQDDRKKKLNLGAWRPTEIIPMSRFFEKIWRELEVQIPEDPARLLQETQMKHIWRSIIDGSQYKQLQDKLLTPVLEAWRLICHYKIENSILENYLEHPDQIIFDEWLKCYQATCQEQQWIDPYTLPTHLLHHASNVVKWLDGKTIHLYGFIDFPPLYQRFFQELQTRGIHCQHIAAEKIEETCHVKRIFKDTEDELDRMLEWCATSWTPTTQIACIVPTLNQDKQMLQRRLSRKLSPEHFNIANPQSLFDYPLIEETLLLLKWQHKPLKLSTIERLLRSFLFNWSQFSPEGLFTIGEKLRQQKLFECSYINFAMLASSSDIKLPFAAASHEPQPLAVWGKTFARFLTQFGWASQSMNAIEMDLIQKWHTVIETLQRIDPLHKAVEIDSALHLLEMLLKETVYESNVNHHAPVQILGHLEAGGLTFDSIWISNMTESQWPTPLNPNPFLATRLQRHLKIPNADPGHTLIFYQRLFDQLHHSAKQVIYSLSEFSGDVPQAESHFIAALTCQLPEVTQPSWLNIACEYYQDDFGHAYPSKRLRGGAHGLMLQAECPFKGYARLQLTCDPLEIDDPYINFLIRGQLFHELMARVWQAEPKQDSLKSKQATLKPLLVAHLDEIIKNFSLEDNFPPRLLSLEKSRVTSLALEWLEVNDLTRPPFEVREVEAEKHIEIDGIQIYFRIDRIDTLPSGDRLIIDYKTGLPQLTKTISTPLLDPQLPLYLIATKAQGFAFAVARHKETNLKGIAKNDWGLKGIKVAESWDALLEIWQKEISRLIREIKAGFAKASPASSDACQFCELDTICRIKEVA